MKSETLVRQYQTLQSTTGNKPTCKKNCLVYCFDAANMNRHCAIKKRAIYYELEKKNFGKNN